MASRREIREKTGAFDTRSAKEAAALQKRIAALFGDFCDMIGRIGQMYSASVAIDRPFRLEDYPNISNAVDGAARELSDAITEAARASVRTQWALANLKNDTLCDTYIGTLATLLSKEAKERYYRGTEKALDAFIRRREGGLTLSQRVWRYAKQSKGEVEKTLELGIKTGQSAAEMSRDLRQYLKYPDKLFRRVRDKKGELHLSRSAKAFHPGQGVYRSSYKNALRLAATETNMAYRTADTERRRVLDFVVGIEIRLSNNHTLNGKPFRDICDDLAGKYPKWFVFRGWHPFCRCVSISILKTDEEFIRDLDGVDRGSVNAVKELPPQFKEWAEANRERIERAGERGTLPYFITDNRDATMRAAGLSTISYEETLRRAAERHAARTPEQVADIRNRWADRAIANVRYTPETDAGPIFDRAVIFRDNRRAFFGETLGSEEMRIFSAAIDSAKAEADPEKRRALKAIVNNEYLRLRKNHEYDVPAEILESVTRYANGLEADVSVLPKVWKSRYKKTIASIRAHDIQKRGYASIYRDIEFISNTAALSHNRRALAIGLDKISQNTPAVLFDDIGKMFGVKNYPIPEKKFFDAFGSSYVPLYLRPNANVKEAWYSSRWRHVVITNHWDIRDRMRTPYFRKSLIYHEYGHAYDYLNNVRRSEPFRKFLSWFDGEISRYQEDDICMYFDKWKAKFNEAAAAGQSLEKKEIVGAIADSVQGRTKSCRFLDSLGHEPEYYLQGGEHIRETEVIANFNAIYWMKPSLPNEKGYRKLREMIEELFSEIYP